MNLQCLYVYAIPIMPACRHLSGKQAKLFSKTEKSSKYGVLFHIESNTPRFEAYYGTTNKSVKKDF
ncbi:MAG: hypothetical protein LHW60_05030 [Candidatus Cloacimonetes bacterium]|nr:hypothetical protein [Candidatus Cloacimonadota bacterium]